MFTDISGPSGLPVLIVMAALVVSLVVIFVRGSRSKSREP